MNTASPREAVHTWAALDLGSNSFHMLLARPAGASFSVEERLKEKVQLLGGFSDGLIRADAQQRGLACLARFAQRLAPIAPDRVMVMGTYALREAVNAGVFVDAAEQILGVPVHVISGAVEAQLIYRAVAHHAGDHSVPKLALDVGGGSTELAFGQGVQVQNAESINIGCVAFKDRFFTQATFQASGYAAAKAHARAELAAKLKDSKLHWALRAADHVSVYGTSGTVESIQTVLSANGWAGDVVTKEAMARLETALLEDRWVVQAGLPGLAPDRTDIFPAGVAIVSACFEALGIERLEYVDVSLLQGMICERVLQDTEADLRADSVVQLMRRFNVDTDQADRVTRCAERLYAQAQSWFGDDEECAQLLHWAAQLHELGVHISAKHYHRHGAYVIKHAQLPGFSQHLQGILALLVRGHRRSMPGLAFRAFDPALEHKLLRLVALLRIAVILERSHSDADSPRVKISLAADRLRLDCGKGWLAAHPLSARELVVEQAQQASAGIELELVDLPQT